MSKIPLSMAEGDIIYGRSWSASGVHRHRHEGSRPGIRGKVRVISNSTRSRTRASEGLMIRPPRPKCVGEDAQPLFAEMAALEPSSGVPRPGLGRIPPPAGVVRANHGIGRRKGE